MNTSTKKILSFSLLFFLATSAFAGFVFFEIFEKGDKLEQQKNILAENKSKETDYFKAQRLLRESEENRKNLSAKFFYGENDIVVFLDSLDRLALDFGLDLETESLERVEDDKKNKITKITFNFSGAEEKVIAFSELLENIPYHSYLDNLNIKRTELGLWKGRTVLVVTMQEL